MLYGRHDFGQVWDQCTATAACSGRRVSSRASTQIPSFRHKIEFVIATRLAASWSSKYSASLVDEYRLLINDLTRLEDVVTSICRRDENDVTVIINLAASRQGPGPVCLLDVAPGRFEIGV